MQMTTTSRGLQTAKRLTTWAEDRAHRVLERFRERIRALDIRIDRVSGPRGAPLHHCRVTIDLLDGSRVVTNERHARDGGSVQLALAGARHRLAEHVNRQRSAPSPI